MISCVGFIFKFIVPIEWIGITGILPIIIGIWHLIKSVRINKNGIDTYYHYLFNNTWGLVLNSNFVCEQ